MTRPTVLLATPFFPPDLGGVERYTWSLARLLESGHGYRVVVATTAGRDTAPGLHEGPSGIPVHRLAIRWRVSHTPLALGWRRELRRIIRDERVSLVNGHAPVPLFADVAALACDDVPFVLTYHTGRMRKGNPLLDMALAAYERTLLARTARRAAELVCSSDYVRADLAPLSAVPSTTIPPGADLGRFTAGPVPAEPRVLFAASLERSASYKGLPDLLRAVAGLAPTMPDLRLDVAGDGSALPGLRRLAERLGIAERVCFRGVLTGEALVDAYRRARVVALPTHYDSSPTVLIEAMACGRPVVSTRVGGIPDLVGADERGLLVTPGSVPELVGALSTLLTDLPYARRLGAEGRRFIRTELSWEHQARRTAEVFDRVLRRHGGSGHGGSGGGAR